MVCRQCGQNIPDDSEFCPNCGAATGVRRQEPAPPPPYGAPGQQPGYQQPGYQGPGYQQPGAWGAASGAVEVPNYLVQSILVTVLCCLPTGIAAIVYAAQANSKKTAGDYAGAIEAANKAKTWCWISLGVGAVVTVIYVLVTIAAQSGSEF